MIPQKAQSNRGDHLKSLRRFKWKIHREDAQGSTNGPGPASMEKVEAAARVVSLGLEDAPAVVGEAQGSV
jgi:hypothetical protein